VRAYDETFNGLAVPMTCLFDLRGELADFGDGTDDMGAGSDETPLLGEGINGVLRHGLKGLRGDVDAVKV
jgi:hypothetical protein